MNSLIMFLIREHDIKSYAQLIRFLRDFDDPKLLKYARRNTYPLKAYFTSKKYRAR